MFPGISLPMKIFTTKMKEKGDNKNFLHEKCATGLFCKCTELRSKIKSSIYIQATTDFTIFEVDCLQIIPSSIQMERFT